MISLDSYLDGITTVAISGHIRPDGDCVGSCLAVYNYICDNYPTIMADLYLEPIPEKFLFLKNADKIRHMKSTDGKKEYDLFIALDCGDVDRHRQTPLQSVPHPYKKQNADLPYMYRFHSDIQTPPLLRLP